MKNVASSIYERYGFWAIVAVAVIVVGLWIAAHYTAASGSTVSVLWGLVEYTKKDRFTLAERPVVAPAEISRTRSGDYGPAPKSVQPTAQAATPNKPEATPSVAFQPAGRHKIILVSGADRTYLHLTPRQLLDSVKGMTDLQTNLFFEQTYKGKWIRIHGPIDSILGSPGNAMLTFNIDGVLTGFNLMESHFEKVTHLREGDTVTIEGRLKMLRIRYLVLDNGQIVGEEQPSDAID